MANEYFGPTERVGYLAFMLARGAAYTPRELAAELGVSPHGARAMLNRLSCVLPIVRDDDTGLWRVLGDDDDQVSDA